MQFQLYLSTVVSIEDPEDKGRIQVRPHPVMTDLKDEDCVWVRPFLATASNEYFINIPQPDSTVWVLDFDNFVYNSYYLPYSILDGVLDLNEDFSSLEDIDDLNIGDSFDVAFHKTPDGSIIFRNKKNGAMGILHKTGSFVTINDNGNIAFKSGDTSKVEIQTDGSINITGTNITYDGNSTFKNGQLSTGTGSSAILSPGSGGFLATPVCLMTGAPICGDKIQCSV